MCCAFRDNFPCDIKLKTDDHKIITAHKVVLASACQYFYEMFINSSEWNNDLAVIRHIDSTALQLLVKFFYTGDIEITGENVQVR